MKHGPDGGQEPLSEILIFLADGIYTGQRNGSTGDAVGAAGAGDARVIERDNLVLNPAGAFDAVATLLGIVLTCVYLLGLLERKDRTIFRMGYDSVAMIVIYGAGLVLLYFLQGTRTGG